MWETNEGPQFVEEIAEKFYWLSDEHFSANLRQLSLKASSPVKSYDNVSSIKFSLEDSTTGLPKSHYNFFQTSNNEYEDFSGSR